MTYPINNGENEIVYLCFGDKENRKCSTYVNFSFKCFKRNVTIGKHVCQAFMKIHKQIITYVKNRDRFNHKGINHYLPMKCSLDHRDRS